MRKPTIVAAALALTVAAVVLLAADHRRVRVLDVVSDVVGHFDALGRMLAGLSIDFGDDSPDLAARPDCSEWGLGFFWRLPGALPLTADDVRACLAAGADPMARFGRDPDYTPLHRVAAAGNVGAIKVLLDAGADPNVRNNRNHTPLHFAATQDRIGAVKVLLDAGADPNAQDFQYCTVLETALAGRSNAVPEMLVAAGGVCRMECSLMRSWIYRRCQEWELLKLLRGAKP